MYKIPANIIARAEGNKRFSAIEDDEQFTNPAKQYADFPFNAEKRKFCQEMYKEVFKVIRSEGEDEVRIVKSLAFGKYTSIDLYLVGIYYQGDLSPASLKRIPPQVFVRLGYEEGRPPNDFFSNNGQFIISLTSWSHLLLENCPIHQSLIKSSTYCNKRNKILSSSLSFSLTKNSIRLFGALKLDYNHAFNDDEFGMLAGRTVYVETPNTAKLSSWGKHVWEKNMKLDAVAVAATTITSTTTTSTTTNTTTSTSTSAFLLVESTSATDNNALVAADGALLLVQSTTDALLVESTSAAANNALVAAEDAGSLLLVQSTTDALLIESTAAATAATAATAAAAAAAVAAAVISARKTSKLQLQKDNDAKRK